MPPTAKVYLV
ncbi:hypothetical protein YPPY12_3753, partial [Yersinia pestis PY-12]